MIVANIGKIFDPTMMDTHIINPLPILIAPIFGWFLLVGLLLMAFVLAWFDKVAFIVVLNVICFIAFLLGLSLRYTVRT